MQKWRSLASSKENATLSSLMWPDYWISAGLHHLSTVSLLSMEVHASLPLPVEAAELLVQRCDATFWKSPTSHADVLSNLLSLTLIRWLVQAKQIGVKVATGPRSFIQGLRLSVCSTFSLNCLRQIGGLKLWGLVGAIAANRYGMLMVTLGLIKSPKNLW